jgi:hypothetical protein
VQQVTAAVGKKLLCVGLSFCRVQVDAHEYRPGLDLCAPQSLPSRRATAFNEKIIQIGPTNFHLMRDARSLLANAKIDSAWQSRDATFPRAAVSRLLFDSGARHLFSTVDI